jgi:hypothetical protein
VIVIDVSAIVARLHTVCARREPTRLRCQQDAAALRKDVAALVTAAMVLQQEADTPTARRLLRGAVRTATAVQALPAQDGDRASVEQLAAATAKLLEAVTKRPVPAQPVSRADHLAQLLRRRIASGTYPPGTKLPTRAQLMTDEKALAGTVSGAVGQLAAEGLLVAVRGSGTWVVPTARARLTATGLMRKGNVR